MKKKYIDAEKLIAEIDKRLDIFEHGIAYDCWASSKELAISLQQEWPDPLKIWLTKQFNLAQKCMKSAERNWNRAYENGQMEAYGNVLSFIGGSPYEPSKQEQPEVDLDEETLAKEFHTIQDKCFNQGIEGWQREKLIARHFYELGFNARKEGQK